MHVPYLTTEAIEEAAQDLLLRFQRETGQPFLLFPIDIEFACEVLFGLETKPVDFVECGIQSRYPDGLDPSASSEDDVLLGALYPEGYPDFEGDEKVILVNAMVVATLTRLGPLQSKERERFTVAHEGIGHYGLHVARAGLHRRESAARRRPTARPFACRANSIFPKAPRGSFDRAEWQANRAAAAFLMPESEIRSHLGRPRELWAQPFTKDLCRRFGVSRFALELRLAQLGYECKDSAGLGKKPRERRYGSARGW